MTIHARLAKQAAEEYVRYGKMLTEPRHLPPEMTSQQACYVHILQKPGRKLKASFGYPLPRYQTLAQEIIHNTISALRARAASVIRRPDFGSLVYRVDVVEPLQRISIAAQLNPGVFGLYVRSDQGKTSIILPGRTGIETPDHQIATAFREAAIDPRREAATLYRFEVNSYE